ncbi:M20/M25/M40 family metallo-hydrolase [Rufibacter quisquiliarum]|uniref:Zn-dependent M28 family amino/carboxypeptidase n=1 Tax=Rufibacter quisquiliarum TaxID=1549639 RepID=A0A839GLV9_9BACT|nr:M28 family metallopeptidase [Rufibacter quisquiliarum]MBA9075966.1 Zn-dependent M28 family amino/carboxypeptidase [Rufibacter quisquiliarum]
MTSISSFARAGVAALGIFFFTPSLHAQVLVKADPTIQNLTRQVSAQELERLVRGLVSFETRHSLSSTKDKKKGIGAARNWAQAELEKAAATANGRMTVTQDRYTVKADGRRIPQDVEMANVMATLKGTDPNDDRVFIVSGHIDSRNTDVMDATGKAPGANDDGSGTAAVIELARVMARQTFPATIIFVCVQGEEQGLYGAKHLAERARKENWNLVAMLNNDMIGNSYSDETRLHDNTRVRIFSEGVPALETPEMAAWRKSTGGENDSRSRQLARYMKEMGTRYVPQLDVVLNYRTDRFLRGGDHTPFSQAGFTAVRVCEMNENYQYQHQNVRTENGIAYGDFPEHVDFEYLRKNTTLNLATLANLALAPASPEEVGVVTSNLTNQTELRWKAPTKGEKPAGYYILMRETASPMWEKKIYVEGTTTTLPYSKDNYFFAVQAVDAEGHESLPIMPKPIR